MEQAYKIRKKVLIRRDKGGLGDIFMHRMIFEDFKRIMPECHLTLACPEEYHQAVQDHPFLDAVVPCSVSDSDYGAIYNTSFVCHRYEARTAPFIDKHRSDIWAEHCGVNLINHNMHFRVSNEEITYAKELIGENAVIISPVSAMIGKNLDMKTVHAIAEELKDYDVFLLHNRPLLSHLPQLTCDIRQFMAVINQAKYVISVDTATLHCAGGMNKSTTGIFTFIDGKVYAKYYPSVILVQKHRDDGWSCGPCYNYVSCPKLPGVKELRKPCITELTMDEIMIGIHKMLDI